MIKTINLSFDPSAGSIPKKISSKQLDNKSRVLSVRLVDANEINFKNATVLLRGTKPDSTIFDIIGERTDTENRFDFLLTESALSAAGNIKCDVICNWAENGEQKSCSTELFFIENISSAVNPDSEAMQNELQSIPKAVNDALKNAKQSGDFNGKSAFELAQENGFDDSEQEWLASLKGENGLNASGAWRGKKMIVFGSNLSASAADDGGYIKIAASRNGFSSFVNAATQYGLINSIYIKVQATDLADFDLIVLEFGANDYRASTKNDFSDLFGEIDGERDTSSFDGAMRACLDYISKSYPEKKVLIVADSQMNKGNYNIDQSNLQNLRQVEYVDTMIKIAAMYSVPICDLYRNSGINVHNISHLTVDGEIPNALGHKQIGNLVASAIDAMYCDFEPSEACASGNDIDMDERGLPFDNIESETTNSYINSDGAVTSNRFFVTTEPIAVIPGEKMKYVGTVEHNTISASAVCGYDAENNFVKVIVGNGNYESGRVFTVEDGIFFIRACFRNTGTRFIQRLTSVL